MRSTTPGRRRPLFRLHVCHGCCCGTQRKHPGADHERHRRELMSAALAGGGEGRIVGCLGPCSASNVIVVRHPGQPAVWLGRLRGEAIVAEACLWLADGAGPVPPTLEAHVLDPVPDVTVPLPLPRVAPG